MSQFQPMMYKNNMGSPINPNNPHQMSNMMHGQPNPYSHYNTPHIPSNSPQYNSKNMQKQNKKYNNQPNHNNNSNNNSNSNNNNNNNNNNKGPTRDTWKSPYNSSKDNLRFFMFQYKVDACPQRRNCPSKVTCRGWHHEGEKRRNPMPNGSPPIYSEEPCPNVKSQGSNKWKQPHLCPDGDECPYSHTLLEQMYHPNIYKTSMCMNFTSPQGNKCQWGYYCTHAHGPDDIRSPKTGPNKDDSNKNNNSNSNKVKSPDSKNNKNINNNKKNQTQMKMRMRASSDSDARYGYDINMINNRQRMIQQMNNNNYSPQRYYNDNNNQSRQPLIEMNNQRSPLPMRGGYPPYQPTSDNFHLNQLNISKNEMINNPYIQEDLMYPPFQQQMQQPRMSNNQYNPYSNQKMINNNNFNDSNNNNNNNMRPQNRPKRSMSDSDKIYLNNWTTQIGRTSKMEAIPDHIDLPSLKHVVSPAPHDFNATLALSPKQRSNVSKKSTNSDFPEFKNVVSTTPPPPSADSIKKNSNSNEKKSVNEDDNDSDNGEKNDKNGKKKRYNIPKTRQTRTRSLPAPMLHDPNDFPNTHPSIDLQFSNDSLFKHLISPNDNGGGSGKYNNTNKNNNNAYGQIFGFDNMNTPKNLYNINSNNKPKDLPTTPPPNLMSRNSVRGGIGGTKNNFVYINDNNDGYVAEIDKLKAQLRLASLKIEQLTKEAKAKSSKEDDNDSKHNNEATDDEFEDTDSIGLSKKEKLSKKNRTRLQTYWHIVKCPNCDSAEAQRNQVIIPCGHLLCTNCTENTIKICPVCDTNCDKIQVLKL